MKWQKTVVWLIAWSLLFALLCGCAAPEKVHYPSREGDEVLSAGETQLPAEKVERFSIAYLAGGGFNPFVCDSLTNRTAFSFLYESLFTVTSDLRVEPVLCDTFTVSEDQCSYYFKLVEGVAFSDGTPLQAQDVVNSLLAAKQSSFYAARLKYLASVTAVDALTISITLNTAYENLPLVLDVPIVKQANETEQYPTGTGPYRLVKTGDKLCMQRNHNWWQDGAPVIDVPEIPMFAASSATQIRDAFEFGSIDLVCTDPNAAYAAGYHCNYEVWDCTTTNMQYIGFNLASDIFKGDEMRCAVTYAVNRAELVKTQMNGYAVPTSIPCIPGSPYYDDPLAAAYDYAPEKFRTALKASAIQTKEEPGVLLVCSTDPTHVAIAQAIAQELERYGLYLKVDARDYSSYLSALRSNKFDCYYGEVKLTANFDLGCFYDANGKVNYGSMEDTSLSEQCREALENSGNYHSLFTNIMRDGAICPVLFKKYAVYMSRGTVEYLVPAVDNVLHTAGGRTLSDASVPLVTEPMQTEEETNP